MQTLSLPEVKFWWEPFIPQAAMVLVHGKFGTFKTPILTNVAKAITQGTEILNYPTQQGKVLFVQADTPKTVIVPRLQALGVAIDNLDFAFCYPGFDIVAPAAEGELSLFFHDLLRKKHKEHKYDVVFIDSLRAIHRLDDKEATSVHTVYRACHKLFYGATICLIHHDKKFNKDSSKDETFSGSQAWANHATVTLKFSHLDQQQREIQIEHMKTQASELVPPIKVTMGQNGVEILQDSASDMQAIESFVRGLIAQDMDSKEIDNQLAEYFNISPRTARRRRKELGL